MKTIRTMAMAALLVLIPLAAAAAEAPPHTVVPQPAPSTSSTPPAECQATVKAGMALTATFVGLPDAPGFTAKGQGELCYDIEGKQAKIHSESIPRLTYESDKPVSGFAALTVIVDAMPGTTPVVSWQAFPQVVLEHADLRVRAYEGRAAEISASSTPVVDLVLTDLMLTTSPIAVEGESSVGYIDADALEAKLVGRTVLPEADLPEYEQWLAGQMVLLELVVQVENPFEKKPAS